MIMGEIIDLRKRIRVETGTEETADDFVYAQVSSRQRELPLKKRSGWWKGVLVIVSAVALTTAGIKASDSLFGSGAEQDQSLCPAGMVFVSSPQGGFCIDQYEASPGAGCEYSDPANQNETFKDIENPDCRPVSDPGRMPWRNISQNQAAVACAKAGKRLPTSEEWVRAALGTPDKMTGWKEADCQVKNNWLSQPGVSGSGKNCVSAAGAYDMVGNVWEWVDGVVSEGAIDGKELPAEGYVKGYDAEGFPIETNPEMGDENYYYDYVWLKKTGSRGVARGGYWGNGAEAGQYSIYMVTEPSYAGIGVGFRCVK
jgi:formylglycine-generating enzyme required for sulfatase activity